MRNRYQKYKFVEMITKNALLTRAVVLFTCVIVLGFISIIEACLDNYLLAILFAASALVPLFTGIVQYIRYKTFRPAAVVAEKAVKEAAAYNTEYQYGQLIISE